MKEVRKDMNINDVLLKVKQVANKQDKTDNRLLTNSKEIVGAINENKSSLEETKNEVNSLNTSKVDKIEGKSLSTNDYDNVEKAKVATITNKAEKTTTDNLQSQVDNLVLHSGGDSNLEVAQARVDYVGNTFPTLKSKDDNVEKLLFEMSSIYNKITFEQGGTGTNGDYSTTNRLRSVGFFNIITSRNN